MRWLLHGVLTSAVGDALVRHGHQVRDPASLSLPNDAPAEQVLKTARREQLEIITSDGALVQAIYDQGLWFQRTIVYLRAGDGDVEQDDAVDRLFERYKRLSPGRLYTVTETRVKIRQLPGRRTEQGSLRAGDADAGEADADEQ